MKFVDETSIHAAGGRGGNGCLSFRREKFLPKGGPDGGNGGRGGNVVLVASSDVQSLTNVDSRRRFFAEHGEHGSGAAKNGRAGRDVMVTVPCGTVVYDAETGEGLADLVEPGDVYIAALGGRGGRGNRAFASSRRRTPRFSERGGEGEAFDLSLRLKLIADIGLVGLPNAGKSSILASISNAAPKVADYPFTTLTPNLGVLQTDTERIVIADIPGLIEGASDDKGLGLKFLRHIERTRLLVHVVDISSADPDRITADIRAVRTEMQAYDPNLARRATLMLGNKLDLVPLDDRAALDADLRNRSAEIGLSYISVSAATGENIDALADELIAFTRVNPRPAGAHKLFATARETIGSAISPVSKKHKVQIIALPDGSYRVLHPQIEQAAGRYDFSQAENIARFTKLLRKYRVEELLTASGAEDGAKISVGPMDFDFHPDVLPHD